MALYTRIYVYMYIYVYGIWEKGYDVIYAPPPNQLVYVDYVAHSGRDDIMGCPQRLDDVMYTYTYAWHDIYTYVHDIINVSEFTKLFRLTGKIFYSIFHLCL